MKFFFNRKTIIAAASVSILYAVYFYWSNSGIEGVYRCDGIKQGSEEQAFIVLYDGKISGAIYDGTEFKRLSQLFSYYEDDGKYFIYRSMINDTIINNEIAADFSELTWPYYDDVINEEGLEKKNGDLSRVLNPFLKSKIHRANRFYYSEEDGGSILGLW